MPIFFSSPILLHCATTQLRELASCRQLDRIRLGPRPGERVRSVVSAPTKEKFKLSALAGLDSEGQGQSMGMVDLDESSSSGDEEELKS